MTMSHQEEVSDLVAHLFRHKSGQIISVLVSIFGFEYLDLAEDVVQETLLKALHQWPLSGVPKNPAGWMIRVAKNQTVDELRRRSLFQSKQTEITQQLEEQLDHPENSSPFQDEQLALMFACCHDAFPQDVQISLVLKSLCGFSVSEIARAFLTQESTIAQRIVRAKRKIREENVRFEKLDLSKIRSRLDSVLNILYLMFNEGYSASQGEELIRKDICEEAIRLACMLSEHPAGDLPKTHALLSLMFFHASRFATRVDSDGNLLLLADQNRSQWDHNLIQQGFEQLERAGQGSELTVYHLQAGIASCHAVASNYASTNWARILYFYDALLEIAPSPLWKLNRAVAVSMIDGPQAGLIELDSIRDDSMMTNYYLYHATLADFYRRVGNQSEAIRNYEKTLELARTQPERAFVERRLKELSPRRH